MKKKFFNHKSVVEKHSSPESPEKHDSTKNESSTNSSGNIQHNIMNQNNYKIQDQILISDENQLKEAKSQDIVPFPKIDILKIKAKIFSEQKSENNAYLVNPNQSDQIQPLIKNESKGNSLTLPDEYNDVQFSGEINSKNGGYQSPQNLESKSEQQIIEEKSDPFGKSNQPGYMENVPEKEKNPPSMKYPGYEEEDKKVSNQIPETKKSSNSNSSSKSNLNNNEIKKNEVQDNVQYPPNPGFPGQKPRLVINPNFISKLPNDVQVENLKVDNEQINLKGSLQSIPEAKDPAIMSYGDKNGEYIDPKLIPSEEVIQREPVQLISTKKLEHETRSLPFEDNKMNYKTSPNREKENPNALQNYSSGNNAIQSNIQNHPNSSAPKTGYIPSKNEKTFTGDGGNEKQIPSKVQRLIRHEVVLEGVFPKDIFIKFDTFPSNKREIEEMRNQSKGVEISKKESKKGKELTKKLYHDGVNLGGEGFNV